MDKGHSSPYNDVRYWEKQLGQENVWRGMFCPLARAPYPLFINSTIINPERGTLGCDWAGYPNAHALLGFVQYVHLPTVFFSALHRDLPRMFTPLESQQALVDIIRTSGDERAPLMVEMLGMVNRLWPLCEGRLRHALWNFCVFFTKTWATMPQPVRLELYASAPAIAQRLRAEYWCDALLAEETGMDHKTLNVLCALAQDEPIYRGLLLHFLNQAPVLLY